MTDSVSTVPSAITGRIRRSVSKASSAGMVSSDSGGRPCTGSPFMTATFMKRTVSKARRTISSARARVTSGGSERIDLRPFDDLLEIVGQAAHEQRIGHQRRGTGGDAGGGQSASLERGHLDDAVARVVEVAAADCDVVVQPRRRRRHDREE